MTALGMSHIGLPRVRTFRCMSSPLPSYLKSYRQRSGLTQRELAILLGFTTHVNISRYERCARLPHVEAAFALEILFDAHIAELFPAWSADVAEDLLYRVQRLKYDFEQGVTPRDQLKATSLADMHARLKRCRVPQS